MCHLSVSDVSGVNADITMVINRCWARHNIGTQKQCAKNKKVAHYRFLMWVVAHIM